MICSYIKLYGPSIFEAIKKFKQFSSKEGELITTLLMRETPTAGPLNSAIKASRELIGKQDFVFEWHKKPELEDIEELIRAIDELIKPTGCRYTISTKE
jgi:hypothetical protein